MKPLEFANFSTHLISDNIRQNDNLNILIGLCLCRYEFSLKASVAITKINKCFSFDCLLHNQIHIEMSECDDFYHCGT